MKKTEYLYGVHPRQFAELPYKDALTVKIQAAIELRGKILEEDYWTRDDERLNAVIKAIKFNEALISEIDNKDIN
jgi:hypothetical protein